MRNPIDIFTQTHASHTSRHIAGFDSIVNSGSCAVGHIEGQYRRIPALVIDSVTEHDDWRIVNLKGHKGQEAQFDAIGVLGAVDDQQAIDLALMQFGRMFDAVAVDVLPTNTNGLMRHLNTRHYHMRQQMIQPWQLKSLQDVLCAEKPMWDDINLLSHKGQTANLMLDLQRHDDHDGLLSKFDGLPQLLENLEVQEPGFDALIVQYQHLERLTAQLHTAMKNAGKAGVQVTNVTVSKPFKRNKVAQVAVTYDLDDGQNVTILFHNPDSTPSRLAQSDTLISWKIQLNNRDVTGVIQPNQGEGIVLPVLAGRIMKLVNQNSARFKGHQAKKAERVQALTDAEQRLTDKTAQEQVLDIEILDLQQQIDAANEQAKHQQELAQNNQPAPEPEPVIEQTLVSLSTSSPTPEPVPATNPDIEFLQSIIDGRVEPATVDIDNMIELAEKYQDDATVNALVEQALNLINQADQAKQQKLAYQKLAQQVETVKIVNADETGQTVYATLINDDPEVWILKSSHYLSLGSGIFKSFGAETHGGEIIQRFETKEDAEKWAVENGYKLASKKEYVDNVQITVPEPQTNPDVEFLQSIIDGSIEPLTIDFDHIIELGEKYPDDSAFNGLFEQAVNIINQAEQQAAKDMG